MVFRSLLTTSRNPWMNGDPFVIVQRALNEASCAETSKASEPAPLSVRLDAKEDAAAYHVTADLPGLAENEVEVVFDDGVLTIRGEKKIARDSDNGKWHITERSHGAFARKLSLPVGIDVEKIEAHFSKGVLSLTLPKLPPEAPSAKKINIKTVN